MIGMGNRRAISFYPLGSYGFSCHPKICPSNQSINPFTPLHPDSFSQRKGCDGRITLSATRTCTPIQTDLLIGSNEDFRSPGRHWIEPQLWTEFELDRIVSPGFRPRRDCWWEFSFISSRRHHSIQRKDLWKCRGVPFTPESVRLNPINFTIIIV